MRFPGSTRTRFIVLVILAASLLAFDTIRKNRMAAERLERAKVEQAATPPVATSAK